MRTPTRANTTNNKGNRKRCMLKQTTLSLLLCLAFTKVTSQTKDSTYKYYVCIHQKAKPGKAYFAFLTSLEKRETSSIYVEICDEQKNKVESSIVTLKSAKNDSLIKAVQLDSGNVYTFRDLLPGDYNIKIQTIDYTSQEITKIPLSPAKSVKIYVEMGQSDAFIQTSLLCKKKLSARQLKRYIKMKEKKLNS